MIESKFNETTQQGYISEIVGSLIKVKGLESKIRLHDLIKVRNIIGEVIHIYSDHIVAQCFEHTTNLRINEKVSSLNEPLSMELAPGLLGTIFDGIQRPLQQAFEKITNGQLVRGLEIPPLSRTKNS